jgi:hypothetical protein
MASRAQVRIFTIREANEAVHELRRTLPALRRTLHEVEKLEDRLEVLELICNRSVSAENPDLQEYLATRVRYHRKISEFEGMLAGLEAEGYLLRDLDKGVVHFPARRGGDGILLCWSEGEKEIRHWHPLDDGASLDEGRRRELGRGDGTL